MPESTNLHIAIVGAGPGGYAAAFLAADLGMTVTLIDPELNPGGVCIYRADSDRPEELTRLITQMFVAGISAPPLPRVRALRVVRGGRCR